VSPERSLREFKLNDPWYIKPAEKDGRGWGATAALRGALCHWIEVHGIIGHGVEVRLGK
jgi:uptake hydrogenase large subunit